MSIVGVFDENEMVVDCVFRDNVMVVVDAFLLTIEWGEMDWCVLKRNRRGRVVFFFFTIVIKGK